MPETDVIEGALKLKGNVDTICVESIQDLIKLLPSFLTVLVPANISNVVVGNEQPGPSQRNNLWVRLDNAGDFVGLYVYAVGDWRQIYPVPGQIFRIADADANSTMVPKGFALITDTSLIDASQKTFIKSQWHWHNDIADTYYDIFDVAYVGF